MLAPEILYTFAEKTQRQECDENDSAYLAHEESFRAKYRHWRGRSGRSYIFSVYGSLTCPAYENAVLLVACRSKMLACLDLGALPEASLMALRRRYADRLEEVEFQIHVLAEGADERRALIADVSSRAA